MPERSSDEMCTKASFPPPSGEMKPKPFSVLKNLTVPVVILNSFFLGGRPRCGRPGAVAAGKEGERSRKAPKTVDMRLKPALYSG
jgi:hypothetical protein